jgi:ABC-type glycerol-3-phosphate transport system substrate-binding protein
MTARLPAAFLVLAVLSACAQGASTGAPSSSGPGGKEVTGSAASPSPGSAPSNEIVTEADFEEEADAQINESNMEAELATLASEIAADN